MRIEPFSTYNEQTLKLTSWDNMIKSLVVGFTTRNGGESENPFQTFNLGLHVNDNPKNVLSNRIKLSDILGFPTMNWACSEQTHDNQIMQITSENCGTGVFDYNESIKGTDGLYTKEKNILLTLCYADCVPLYFFAPNKNLIGIAHAGWKGTVKDIAGEMVRLWKSEGVEPKEIYAAIGPSIGKCCYMVDDYVIQFVQRLLREGDIQPYEKISVGQYELDLKTLNYQLLKRAGIQDENIQMSSYCTSCKSELFFSHRRDKGKTGRMMSFIGLKED